MSHSLESRDKGPTTAYYEGIDAGKKIENERILKILAAYFELTQIPGDDGEIETDEYWSNGFQAAMAIIKANSDKGEQK